MTYLLDVNLMIALAWPTHVHHAVAQEWFRRRGRKRWATCPLVQTGFVRVSSNPKFIDGAVPPRDAIALLRRATSGTAHEFWPDDLDLAKGDGLPTSDPLGHRQVTDAYLLGLAIRRRGKLATLDASIRTLLRRDADRAKYLEVVVN